MKKIYVGNLSYNCDDRALEGYFTPFGEVVSAKVIMDRDTNRSKGFGFVEMSDDSAAAKAISEFDGKEVDGRSLKVNEARPREPRTGGSNW